MTIKKGTWVAYRPLQAKETLFGTYSSQVDNNYSIVNIGGVPKKCETKTLTVIYEKNLLNKLNEQQG